MSSNVKTYCKTFKKSRPFLGSKPLCKELDCPGCNNLRIPKADKERERKIWYGEPVADAGKFPSIEVSEELTGISKQMLEAAGHSPMGVLSAEKIKSKIEEIYFNTKRARSPLVLYTGFEGMIDFDLRMSGIIGVRTSMYRLKYSKSRFAGTIHYYEIKSKNNLLKCVVDGGKLHVQVGTKRVQYFTDWQQVSNYVNRVYKHLLK